MDRRNDQIPYCRRNDEIPYGRYSSLTHLLEVTSLHMARVPVRKSRRNVQKPKEASGLRTFSPILVLLWFCQMQSMNFSAENVFKAQDNFIEKANPNIVSKMRQKLLTFCSFTLITF